MTDRLFDVGPGADAVPAPERISATRRRTMEQRRLLDRGIHPATRQRVRLEPGKTCGDCAHHVAHGHHDRPWHKCDVHRLGLSLSAASDIRLSWPACELFIEKGEHE